MKVNVFTDRSKTAHEVGSGYTIIKEGKKREAIPLQKHCTVFQAEQIAIKKAADFLYENCNEQNVKYVKIFSDSMSSLQALNTLHMT